MEKITIVLSHQIFAKELEDAPSLQDCLYPIKAEAIPISCGSNEKYAKISFQRFKDFFLSQISSFFAFRDLKCHFRSLNQLWRSKSSVLSQSLLLTVNVYRGFGKNPSNRGFGEIYQIEPPGNLLILTTQSVEECLTYIVTEYSLLKPFKSLSNFPRKLISQTRAEIRLAAVCKPSNVLVTNLH